MNLPSWRPRAFTAKDCGLGPGAGRLSPKSLLRSLSAEKSALIMTSGSGTAFGSSASRRASSAAAAAASAAAVTSSSSSESTSACGVSDASALPFCLPFFFFFCLPFFPLATEAASLSGSGSALAASGSAAPSSSGPSLSDPSELPIIMPKTPVFFCSRGDSSALVLSPSLSLPALPFSLASLSSSFRSCLADIGLRVLARRLEQRWADADHQVR
mmetsp:Transcript_49763/g.108225  ORF Transcript_49763/g.108225 Transcript_49763/m.108225 type:complete len:215 (+) Transcript_49763:98-742(+)